MLIREFTWGFENKSTPKLEAHRTSAFRIMSDYTRVFDERSRVALCQETWIIEVGRHFKLQGDKIGGGKLLAINGRGILFQNNGKDKPDAAAKLEAVPNCLLIYGYTPRPMKKVRGVYIEDPSIPLEPATVLRTFDFGKPIADACLSSDGLLACVLFEKVRPRNENGAFDWEDYSHQQTCEYAIIDMDD